MKALRGLLILLGVLGVSAYILLAFSLRLQLFGVLDQPTEIAIEVLVHRSLFCISILMPMLAFAARWAIVKKGGKVPMRIMMIYFIPLILEMSMVVFLLGETLYFDLTYSKYHH